MGNIVFRSPKSAALNLARGYFNFGLKPLTHSHGSHRIPPNMHKHGLGTMTMTTTSGNHREVFVLGQK